MKYRTVKVGSNYKLQYRFLWFFWRDSVGNWYSNKEDADRAVILISN